MKKLVVSVVSAAALVTAGMAAANHSMAASDQSFSANSARGVYVGGNLGVGIVDAKKSDFNDPFTNAAPSKFTRYGFAWAANLGYQFNKYLALEAGYMTFGKVKANTSLAGTPTTVTENFGGFDAAVKGILPVSSQFNLYGKAGAVDMHDDADMSVANASTRAHGDTWVPMIGVGTSYDLTHKVALTVEDNYTFRTNYKHAGNSAFMPALDNVLAGVTYKFNV